MTFDVAGRTSAQTLSDIGRDRNRGSLDLLRQRVPLIGRQLSGRLVGKSNQGICVVKHSALVEVPHPPMGISTRAWKEAPQPVIRRPDEERMTNR